MLIAPGFYRPFSLTYISESGSPTSGFEGYNTSEERQGLYWLVPSGGPHQITLQTPVSVWLEDLGFIITSPAGRPMVGDITVDLLVDPGGADISYGPYTLEKWNPDTVRDHRILIPNEASLGSDYVVQVTVTAATGGCISRVCGINFFEYTGSSVDSTLFERGWVQGQVPIIRQAKNNGGGIFYSAGYNTAPIRYKTLSGVLQYDEMPNLPSSGKRTELVVLPSVAEYAAAEELRKLMHIQAIFGRRTSDLAYQLRDLAGNLQVPLQFKELI